jgi:large subunit ribosomal protein L15
MQLHDLQRHTARKGNKRKGRGRASGKGKTSGRGTKGQKARAGHRIRPDVREKLKKLPKRRGYSFKAMAGAESLVVNLGALNAAFAAGDSITPKILVERGLVRERKGETNTIKILGGGELSKALTVSGCKVSMSAKEKIEKAGGSVA